MIDSTWSEEDIEQLYKFEKDRNLVLRATRRLFADFYNENFAGGEAVLEVGSGTGFLRRNWPSDFGGRWVQIDSQPAFLEEARKMLPEGEYVCGSAYEMPFPDESMDVVCGYGSYDVLFDLNAAIMEAKRVLKRGGLFFHMLDLHACDRPIVEELKNCGLPVMVKGVEKQDGYCTNISVIVVPEQNRAAFDLEIGKVEVSFLENFKGAARHYDRIWDKYGMQIDTDRYFDDKLCEALQSHFDRHSAVNEKLKGKYRGKITAQQAENGSFGFYHDAGDYYTGQKGPAEISYKMLKTFSSRLAHFVEPDCTETSFVRCVKARK